MGLTVRGLLEEGLYLSTSDREFSPVEPNGSRINVALNTFIRLLSVYREEIPFYETKTVTGSDEILDVGASQVNYLQYQLGSNVLYPMKGVSQKEFSRINLISDLRSVPIWYWHDQASDSIKIYPLAQSNSDVFILGFTPLIAATTLDEPLSSSVTPFMQQFLIYELAFNLCLAYSIPWSPDKERARESYHLKMRENSELTISVPKLPMLKGPATHIPWLAYISGNVPGV